MQCIRLLWLVGLLLSLGSCLILIVQITVRWTTSPVVMAMDETQRSILNIPFPAVTVCPMSKIKNSDTNFTRILRDLEERKNVTDKEYQLATDLSLQCDFPVNYKFDDDYDDTKNSTTIDIMEKYSPIHDDMIMLDSFRQKQFKASKMFRPVMTEEGLCLTFNMVPGSHLFADNTFHVSRNYLNYSQDLNWSVDSGYDRSPITTSYPYRALAPGNKIGLTLYLSTKAKDFELLCKMIEEGYKIELHSPADFPRPSQHSFFVPLNSVAQVAVSPFVILSGRTNLRRYSVKNRQCYFQDERPLRFFKQYSHQNCELECLTNLTLRVCRCVAFYMPRDLNTPICGVSKFFCMEYASRIVQMMESGRDIEEEMNNITLLSDLSDLKCNCLQSCTQLRYRSERSYSDMDVDGLRQHYPESYFTTEERYITKVSIYFREFYFIPMKRVELYGTIEFIANCGGLLGLCLGMSLLSIVEVFYWLAVRPCRSRNDDSVKTEQQMA